MTDGKPPPLPPKRPPPLPGRAPSSAVRVPPPAPRVPPPLPRQARPSVPVPAESAERKKLAQAALKLRDEQLKARVVFYNKQSQTNAELDAITEGVIADLRALQLAVDTREEVIDNRAELTRHLRELLEKLLSPRREQLIRLKIQKIQRRIVTLFFESEIYTDIVMESRNVYSHADEALYHVLKKNEHDLLLSLDGLQYEKPEIYEAAVQQLLQFQKRLVNAVLSRSKPELERLLHVYRDVLLVFLMRDFRAEIPAFAHQVIAESNVAAMGGPSYKIRHDAFPAFRAAFETRFLQSLLDGLHEPLTRRLDGSGEETFREETMVFASNPQIYATVCEIVCNTLYEFMHGEGYLDLPVTWQRSLYDG